MEAASDALLVRRAQAGYVEAFEELVVRHRDLAYRVALRLLGSPADAEDVAQDSLVQAWQSLDRFRGDSSFSSWLYRIVVNRCRDAQRRTVARPVDPHGAVLDLRAPQVPDSAEVVERAGRHAALHDAIASLPFELRAPLVLCDLERCSYAEAGEVLDLSEPTLRGRLVRGRRELVKQMRGWS